MISRGFTLIELMVVLLLLALLGGAALLSLRQPYAALREAQTLTTLRRFDADARAAARASGQMQRMVFDLAHHQVQRRDGDDFAVARRQISLSRSDLQLAIEGELQSTGPITIDISPSGWSRSYSVALADRALVIAGLTGQVTERQ